MSYFIKTTTFQKSVFPSNLHQFVLVMFFCDKHELWSDPGLGSQGFYQRKSETLSLLPRVKLFSQFWALCTCNMQAATTQQSKAQLTAVVAASLPESSTCLSAAGFCNNKEISFRRCPAWKQRSIFGRLQRLWSIFWPSWTPLPSWTLPTPTGSLCKSSRMPPSGPSW